MPTPPYGKNLQLINIFFLRGSLRMQERQLKNKEQRRKKLYCSAAQGLPWAMEAVARLEEREAWPMAWTVAQQGVAAASSEAQAGICWDWNRGGCGRKGKCKFAHRCSVVTSMGKACRGAHRSGEHL